MLIDLLNSQNYIMVSMDAIKIFGLNTAVYCAELLNVYKKAYLKKKLVNGNYFKIDRDFIAGRTSLTAEDQLKCDINLSKVGVIHVSEESPDIILFDIETYASLLSSEDVKILEAVSKKVKVENPKGTKKANQAHVISALKDSIECRDVDVLFALKGWIDSIFESGKGMSKIQVKLFKDKLDDYCNGDKVAALKIIEAATVHSYIDCQWAINTYERDVKKIYPKAASFAYADTQKITTAISDETF